MATANGLATVANSPQPKQLEESQYVVKHSFPVVPLLPEDSDQLNQCLFLFRLCSGRHTSFCCNAVFVFKGKIQPGGRPNSLVETRFIGNQSICRWCHFFNSI